MGENLAERYPPATVEGPPPSITPLAASFQSQRSLVNSHYLLLPSRNIKTPLFDTSI